MPHPHTANGASPVRLAVELPASSTRWNLKHRFSVDPQRSRLICTTVPSRTRKGGLGRVVLDAADTSMSPKSMLVVAQVLASFWARSDLHARQRYDECFLTRLHRGETYLELQVRQGNKKWVDRLLCNLDDLNEVRRVTVSLIETIAARSGAPYDAQAHVEALSTPRHVQPVSR